MRTCPYCAEGIQDDVLVCPLCNANIGASAYVAAQAAPVAPPAAPIQPSIPGDAYATSQPQAGQGQTSGKATASLICGIVGWVILPIIASIPAIILGHLALSEIKKSAGRLKGHGLAIAGLVLGYVQMAFMPFLILIIAAIAIPNLIKSKMAANEASAVGSLRSYNYAMGAYAAQCPKIGFPPSLANLSSAPGSADCDHAHLLDNSLAVENPTKSGYSFLYVPGPVNKLGQITSFSLHARPANPGSTGQRYFYEDQTGAIRYNKTGSADEDSPVLE